MTPDTLPNLLKAGLTAPGHLVRCDRRIGGTQWDIGKNYLVSDRGRIDLRDGIHAEFTPLPYGGDWRANTGVKPDCERVDVVFNDGDWECDTGCGSWAWEAEIAFWRPAQAAPASKPAKVKRKWTEYEEIVGQVRLIDIMGSETCVQVRRTKRGLKIRFKR